MPTPKPRRDVPPEQEELDRIDSFREDEDTGGAGAPPLRPRGERPAPSVPADKQKK
jgi:hypothetical protein